VWCGVVWCGVVWCGVVWCGVVQTYAHVTACEGEGDHGTSQREPVTSCVGDKHCSPWLLVCSRYEVLQWVRTEVGPRQLWYSYQRATEHACQGCQ
jgi:hypothetical protein